MYIQQNWSTVILTNSLSCFWMTESDCTITRHYMLVLTYFDFTYGFIVNRVSPRNKVNSKVLSSMSRDILGGKYKNVFQPQIRRPWHSWMRLQRFHRLPGWYCNIFLRWTEVMATGERRHSVPHTHSERTTGAGGYVPVHWVPDYRRWWVYDGIPHQVKQRAGDRGITAEDMEKSQHTDFNEDTTNKSASVACSNICLWKLDSQKE